MSAKKSAAGESSRSAPLESLLGEIFREPVRASTDSVLSIDAVTVEFGGIAALSGIHLDVLCGDAVGVVGPNGAGKSTMLNAISGLISGAIDGEIRFVGQSILRRAPVAIARLGVGRTFQDPPLVESDTVLENVLLGEHLRLAYRMGDQIWRYRRVRRLEVAATQRAMVILDVMGIAALKDNRVGALPYGTRKLIDIARSLVSGPRLLLLDEPTSGLDAQEQEAVGRILVDLRRATTVTLVIVEHHMNVVRAVANRVVALEAGRVLAVGTPTEVLDSEEFRSVVLGANSVKPLEDIAKTR
jgi:ABC-type branched-subunit amino acid transport system ATPase component